jgi:hypothetical protein
VVGGDIGGLGEVAVQVEQCPVVVVEAAAAGKALFLVDDAGRHVAGRGLPANAGILSGLAPAASGMSVT